MKKIFKNGCFFLHLILIAIMEFAVIVSATNYIACKLNYYGILNVFVLIGVAAVWFVTYIAFVKEIERRK